MSYLDDVLTAVVNRSIANGAPVLTEQPDPRHVLHRSGAMCATCGFESIPGSTEDQADTDHAAFDPAHEPLWHAED